MKIFDFLRELELFYPMGESEERIEKRIVAYAEIIQGETLKTGKKYDFKRVLNSILHNYSYKTFPSISNILDRLPDGIVVDEQYSGREGEVITRVINGFPYQFTIVPNHWDRVKSISQLDTEILRRTT